MSEAVPPLMRPYIERAADQLDAAVFTGDFFHRNPEGAARLRWYMARWEQALQEQLTYAAADDSEDVEGRGPAPGEGG